MSIIEVLKIVIIQIWGRVVDTTQPTFFTNFNLRCNGVNRRGGIINVRNRARWWDSLQVLVIDAVLHDGSFELFPVLLGGERAQSLDRKSTRLNSSHVSNSYTAF